LELVRPLKEIAGRREGGEKGVKNAATAGFSPFDAVGAGRRSALLSGRENRFKKKTLFIWKEHSGQLDREELFCLEGEGKGGGRKMYGRRGNSVVIASR